MQITFLVICWVDKKKKDGKQSTKAPLHGIRESVQYVCFATGKYILNFFKIILNSMGEIVA